jgi:hypothetical protein
MLLLFQQIQLAQSRCLRHWMLLFERYQLEQSRQQ